MNNSPAFQQGRLDALSGVENKSKYRRRDKRLEYAQGYRQGQEEKQTQDAITELHDLDDDELQSRRNKIRELKKLLDNPTS